MSELDPTSARHDGPSRRSAEPYWKRAAPDPRFLRRYFTRRALIDTLREMIWLAPLTAIIWIYAEREQITAPTKVDTILNISSSDRSRFVQSSDNNPFRVTLTLKGPQVGVEKVREQLTTSVPRGVPLDIGDELPPGQHQSLDVVSRVQEMPIFKSNGVTVSESQPPQVSINIDTIEDREVDVTVPPDIDRLVSVATFEPRKVHLRGPRSVLNQLVDQGNLKVRADITVSELQATPGKKDLPSVPLTLSQADTGLTIEPPSVHATLDVRAADVTGTIESVPIAIEALPSVWRANDITVDPISMANVRIVGPPDKVQQVIDKHMAKAVVDVDASGQSRLKFELPDGVHAAPGETERPVTVTLHRRDNGG